MSSFFPPQHRSTSTFLHTDFWVTTHASGARTSSCRIDPTMRDQYCASPVDDKYQHPRLHLGASYRTWRMVFFSRRSGLKVGRDYRRPLIFPAHSRGIMWRTERWEERSQGRRNAPYSPLSMYKHRSVSVEEDERFWFEFRYDRREAGVFCVSCCHAFYMYPTNALSMIHCARGKSPCVSDDTAWMDGWMDEHI